MRSHMQNPWTHLRSEQAPAEDARTLERLPATTALGFHVELAMHNGTSWQGALLDFNATSLAVDVTALADRGDCAHAIASITVAHGTQIIRRLTQPTVRLRQDGDQWRLIVLLNPTTRTAEARRRTRIQTRKHFKPVLWVADPLYVNRVLHFSVDNFHAEGLQLRTSLSNKHLLVGSRLGYCQLLLPGIGAVTVHLVVCYASIHNTHLVFGCRFHAMTKSVLEHLAQYAILGGDDLPPELSHRHTLLRTAGFTTRALAKPCTIKVVETRREFEQVLVVRLAAYQAAAKTLPGTTSAMMQDDYDVSALIYCAKYGRDVLATMRANLAQPAGAGFPFEQCFGPCEQLGLERSQVCEISRLAILPAFQGSDLFLGFVKVTLQLLVHLGLDAVVCMATHKLAPMYQKLGGEKLAEPVPHPVVEDEYLNLFRIKTSTLLTGEQMDCPMWQHVAADTMSYFLTHGFLQSADLPERLSLPVAL